MFKKQLPTLRVTSSRFVALCLWIWKLFLANLLWYVEVNYDTMHRLDQVSKTLKKTKKKQCFVNSFWKNIPSFQNKNINLISGNWISKMQLKWSFNWIAAAAFATFSLFIMPSILSWWIIIWFQEYVHAEFWKPMIFWQKTETGLGKYKCSEDRVIWKWCICECITFHLLFSDECLIDDRLSIYQN